MRREAKTLNKAARMIEEVEINELSDAEAYEKSETIGRLAPTDVVDMIKEEGIKEGVNWTKKAHRDIPDNVEFRNAFVKTIKRLFKEVGGLKNIKKWHELESLCEDISEEELKDADEDLKETIKWVQNIHDRSPERRIELMKEVNEEVENPY